MTAQGETDLVIALLVMASRILLPSRPAMVLLSLALVPAAPALGISLWVIGFVVLVAANIWVLPYQGLEYLIARDATNGEAFDDRQGTRVDAALTVVRFAAIALSVPVWLSMGLITPSGTPTAGRCTGCVQRFRALLPLLLLASACGPTVIPASSDPPPAAASKAVPARILIEGDESTRIVDAATGQAAETSLPGGVLSPARDLIVRLEHEGAQTVLTAVDLAGRSTPKLRFTGDYAFPSAYGAAPSGFSPNGAWLVLVSRDTSESRFQIVDIAKWTLAPAVTLSARFTFDAIHDDGSAMYLIEHPVAGDTAYNVRLYRVRSQALDPGIIFDKSQVAQYDATRGLMDGTFHVSVAPKGGDWSYGLYMRPNGTPFVHALNVPGAYAQCILDLAGTWTSSSMFAMAMRDDGKRLYVVDTSGGAVTVIDGDSHAVLTRAQFAGRRPVSAVRTASAVVSRDGSRLYATSTRGIAAIATADLSLTGWMAADLAVSSLAVSSDGTRLYALADGVIQVIDAASGKVITARFADAPDARAIHLLAGR